MKAKTYYIYLSLITVVLSASNPVIPHSILSLVAPLVSLTVLTYLEPYDRLRWREAGIAFASIVISTYFNLFSIIPAIIYLAMLYLLSKGKLTYSRALLSSTITSYAFPVADAFSSYNVLMAPLIVLQASGLAIVKEAIYPGKRALGITAYSIPLVILLALTLGHWLEMLAIAVIAWWALTKAGKEVISYESVLKALVGFSVITFVSYVLPIYVSNANTVAFEYLAKITGFS